MKDLVGVLGFFGSLYLWWFGGKRVAIQLVNKGWSLWFAWPAAAAAGLLLGLGGLFAVVGVTSSGEDVGAVLFLGGVLVAAFAGLLLLMKRGQVPSRAATEITPSIELAPPAPTTVLLQKVQIAKPPPAQPRPSSDVRTVAHTMGGTATVPGAALVFDYSDSDGVLTRRSVSKAAATTDGVHE